MKCEDLQFNLSAYADDCLAAQERSAADAHLSLCPLCRQKAADLQSLKNDLRVLPRAEMPSDLLASLRSRVAEEIKSVQPIEQNKVFTAAVREWLQMRLLPYGIAMAVTLVFGLSLLWSLLAAANTQNSKIARGEPQTKSTILLANNDSSPDFFNPHLSDTDLAAARIPIAKDAPAFNPNGALIALSKSIVRGNMKDDEVVVVADVFGNGLAQIAEVVEPSSDRRAVSELENALRTNPDFAPFVPSSVDGRSDTVRVVLKIQRVDVQTHVNTKRK